MERLTNESTLINRVVALVENHLQPHNLLNARPSRWKRLQDKVERLDVLGWLSRADWAGRPGRSPEVEDHVPSGMCFDWQESLGSKVDVTPRITGHDLIECGLEPGPPFKTALQTALDAQLDGECERDDLLALAMRAGVEAMRAKGINHQEDE